MTLHDRVLELARTQPGRQTSEIADALGYARNRISAAVSVLARRGLVRSERVRVHRGTENRVWPIDAESGFDDE